MQPAKRGDALGRRPQHQVIGVGKQKLGTGGAHVVVMDALDRRLRADRHEGRRLHGAMRGRHLARARGAIGGNEAEGEGIGHRQSDVMRQP